MTWPGVPPSSARPLSTIFRAGDAFSVGPTTPYDTRRLLPALHSLDSEQELPSSGVHTLTCTLLEVLQRPSARLDGRLRLIGHHTDLEELSLDGLHLQ